MLFFLNRADSLGVIGREDWIRAGKEHGVPTLLDAAADVPPACRLSSYVHEGFDLVAISGGKALRGPQSTGLLLGRKDLIATGQKAISPCEGIGRGMKVGKEEIVGLLAALERYLRLDHVAELRLWETRAQELKSKLEAIPGLSVRVDLPAIANHAPHVVVQWRGADYSTTATELRLRLLDDDPPIALLEEGERKCRIAVWTLQCDEHLLIAERLRGLFA
jgi:L-seryl-tRNA(Ser) seleniumtransferase